MLGIYFISEEQANFLDIDPDVVKKVEIKMNNNFWDETLVCCLQYVIDNIFFIQVGFDQEFCSTEEVLSQFSPDEYRTTEILDCTIIQPLSKPMHAYMKLIAI